MSGRTPLDCSCDFFKEGWSGYLGVLVCWCQNPHFNNLSSTEIPISNVIIQPKIPALKPVVIM